MTFLCYEPGLFTAHLSHEQLSLSSSSLRCWLSDDRRHARRAEDASPWILSIWPIFRAAPRTLQSVWTILSALASERKALESKMDFLSPLETKKLLNYSHNQTVGGVKAKRGETASG